MRTYYALLLLKHAYVKEPGVEKSSNIIITYTNNNTLRLFIISGKN